MSLFEVLIRPQIPLSPTWIGFYPTFSHLRKQNQRLARIFLAVAPLPRPPGPSRPGTREEGVGETSTKILRKRREIQNAFAGRSGGAEVRDPGAVDAHGAIDDGPQDRAGFESGSRRQWTAARRDEALEHRARTLLHT